MIGDILEVIAMFIVFCLDYLMICAVLALGTALFAIKRCAVKTTGSGPTGPGGERLVLTSKIGPVTCTITSPAAEVDE
jgi:hypothetical protein